MIKDIRLEGISRTEAGTVFSHLPIRVGDTYSPELGAESLRSLYASGMFQDVQLDMDGNVLVVRVQERPTVANIHTTGISEFDAKGVEKSLRDVGLAEGFIFDRAVLDRAVQELRRQYLSRGRYSADVKVTVTPVERNRQFALCTTTTVTSTSRLTRHKYLSVPISQRFLSPSILMKAKSTQSKISA